MKLISIFVLSAICFAQEASIMIVKETDSQDLAAAYKDYKTAQVRWSTLKNKVAKKYTTEDGKTIEGWKDVQFSADFRALVPASSQYAKSGCLYGRNYSNSILTNNALDSATTTTGTYANISDLYVANDDGIATKLKTKSK